MLGSDTVEHGSRLLSSLTSFVDLLLRWTIPDHARDAIFGASHCDLTKKSGRDQPLAAIICAKYARGLLQTFFSPLVKILFTFGAPTFIPTRGTLTDDFSVEQKAFSNILLLW